MRLLVVFGLTLSLISSASAEDIHPMDAAEIACHEAAADSLEPLRSIIADDLSGLHALIDGSEPDHDHHAHNCGPSHLNAVWGSRLLSGLLQDGRYPSAQGVSVA